MDRERLTKERIKHELLKDLYSTFPGLIILLVFLAVGLYLCLPGVAGVISPKGSINLVVGFFVCLFSFGIIAMIVIFAKTIRDIINVKNDRFFIFTDQLVGSSQSENRLGFSLHSGQDELHFLHHGKFYIPGGWNYKWSKLNYMSAKNVFRSSSIGDTFISVSIDGKKFHKFITPNCLNLLIKRESNTNDLCCSLFFWGHFYPLLVKGQGVWYNFFAKPKK